MGVTCADGYPDWTLLFVLALEAHHIWAESHAWAAAKNLVTPPERTIMQHFGVFRWRRRMVLLGVLAEIDTYTDLTFPLLAKACDSELTAHWERAWIEVPVLGPTTVSLVHHLRFWGVAAVFVFLNVLLTGFGGLFRMAQEMYSSPQDAVDTDHGVHGVAFLVWAKAAEVAAMPSVAMLCTEMAAQKRYIFDEDAEGATEARQEAALGKLDYQTALEREQIDREAKEQLDAEEQCYFVSVIIVKTFIGNMLQLWLQASFFALTFDSTGAKAKYKVIASMAISALQAMVSSYNAISRLSGFGAVMAGLLWAFLAWVAAKMYYSYRCPDHLWNLTSGCVYMSDN